MKLQFSLATLLLCMAVLSVVSLLSAKLPVQDSETVTKTYWKFGSGRPINDPDTYNVTTIEKIQRPPKAFEVMGRLVIWGTPAIGATLAVLWTIRRLKSRRHTEPPVG